MNICRFAAHTIGVLPACPFLVLAPDPVAPPNTTIAISMRTPVSTPVSTTIYLSLNLSAQQPRTRPMQQDAAAPLDAHARQTKSTVRSHQSTSTHDRLNLQRTAPLIDTHTRPDPTHSTQQSYAHSSIALSHAAPSDPSHAHSLPLTHPIHSLVGTTLSYNIYSLSHLTTLAHSLNRHTH